MFKQFAGRGRSAAVATALITTALALVPAAASAGTFGSSQLFRSALGAECNIVVSGSRSGGTMTWTSRASCNRTMYQIYIQPFVSDGVASVTTCNPNFFNEFGCRVGGGPQQICSPCSGTETTYTWSGGRSGTTYFPGASFHVMLTTSDAPTADKWVVLPVLPPNCETYVGNRYANCNVAGAALS